MSVFALLPLLPLTLVPPSGVTLFGARLPVSLSSARSHPCVERARQRLADAVVRRFAERRNLCLSRHTEERARNRSINDTPGARIEGGSPVSYDYMAAPAARTDRFAPPASAAGAAAAAGAVGRSAPEILFAGARVPPRVASQRARFFHCAPAASMSPTHPRRHASQVSATSAVSRSAGCLARRRRSTQMCPSPHRLGRRWPGSRLACPCRRQQRSRGRRAESCPRTLARRARRVGASSRRLAPPAWLLARPRSSTSPARGCGRTGRTSGSEPPLVCCTAHPTSRTHPHTNLRRAYDNAGFCVLSYGEPFSPERVNHHHQCATNRTLCSCAWQGHGRHARCAACAQLWGEAGAPEASCPCSAWPACS